MPCGLLVWIGMAQTDVEQRPTCAASGQGRIKAYSGMINDERLQVRADKSLPASQFRQPLS